MRRAVVLFAVVGATACGDNSGPGGNAPKLFLAPDGFDRLRLIESEPRPF